MLSHSNGYHSPTSDAIRACCFITPPDKEVTARKLKSPEGKFIMLELIKTRRSIRKFTSQKIEDEHLNQIIEAGMWAPSGLNNQPWRIAVIRDSHTKQSIAPLTRYSPIIEGAPVLLLVFLDANSSYDRTKDIQAIGACIQNMLLIIHALELGGVWLGEILKNKDKVSEIVNAPDNLELMAIIALGHPEEQGGRAYRKSVEEIVFLKD